MHHSAIVRASGSPLDRPAPDRVLAIDALRAVALYGVILINVLSVSLMVAADEIIAAADPGDMAIAVLDTALVQGKARSCFAFLFGMGFGIALERADRAGENATRLHMRRMAALLAFGLVNQAFLFWGDILAHYALLGALLPLARRWSTRTLVLTGVTLVALPPLASGAVLAVTGVPLPGLVPADESARAAEALAAYTSPHYRDAVAYNVTFQARAYATQTPHRIEYDLALLGLFLLGLVAARRRVLTDPERHRPQLRRIAAWCLPIGFALGCAHLAQSLGLVPAGRWQGLSVAAFAGLPVMAFGLMAALLLWFSRGARRIQAILAPAGRMTLTNYLLSGALATWTFYGYGLGALGRLNFTGMTAYALALSAALTAFSHLWLSRFRTGPAEGLWRLLVRGRPRRWLPRPECGLPSQGTTSR